MLLAIDTATGAASIALYDGQRVNGETTWRTHANHTRSLMPEIVRLLDLCGASVHEVDALGIATGPGSFTGLRIGLSAAKGLALARRAALIGVPTLDVCAGSFACQTLPVWAVLEAGRGRFAAALYVRQEQVMRRVTEYVFGGPAAIAGQLKTVLSDAVMVEQEKTGNSRLIHDERGASEQRASGLIEGERLDKADNLSRVLVAGELDDALVQALRGELGERVVMADPAVRLRRAGVLAQLAWRRWQAGETDDLNTLAPFYIPTATLGN